MIKPGESKEHERSRKIDAVLTGRYTALPMFAAIMALVFWLTFGVIGAGLQNVMEIGIDWLTQKTDAVMTLWQVNDVLHSLVIDGIFKWCRKCT